MSQFKFIITERNRFLKQRKKDTQEAKIKGLPEQYKEMGFSEENYIVIDVRDEIICDACNGLVQTKNVWQWIEGNRVYCNSCLIRWFSDSELN